jgi:hypothetical protein
MCARLKTFVKGFFSMNTEQNQSKVARLRERLEQEYQAAEWGLHGFAVGVSRHAFITAKMERMGECHQQLAKLIGTDAATRMLVEIIDGTGPAPVKESKEE